MREMRRVLRPGGPVVLATWAELDASPGYAAMVALLRRVVGDAPADALLAPFGVGTEAALRAVAGAAFPDVRVETWEGTARFPSLEAWLSTDIKAWTLADMITDEQFGDLLDAGAHRVGSVLRLRRDGWTFPAPAIVGIATGD